MSAQWIGLEGRTAYVEQFCLGCRMQDLHRVWSLWPLTSRSVERCTLLTTSLPVMQTEHVRTMEISHPELWSKCCNRLILLDVFDCPVAQVMAVDVCWAGCYRGDVSCLLSAVAVFRGAWQSACSRYPASILCKSIASRYLPVIYPDGPITARYRFIKNSYGVLDVYF